MVARYRCGTVRLPSHVFPMLSLGLFGVLLAACTGGPSTAPTTSPSPEGWASQVGSTPVIPVIASTEFAKGKERFLFTLIDQTNHVVADPSVAVRVRFFNLARDATTPASETDAVFYWIIEGQRGLYRAPATFTEAGQWGAEILVRRSGASGSGLTDSGAAGTTDPLASEVTVRVVFSVREHPSTPAIGDPAPPADTPTLETAGGDTHRISTDLDPDPRFYELSIRQAIEAGKPFLLVFATPAFCQTATCGPTLQVVKQVVADYPTLTAIHVEPYELVERDGALQPVVDANGNFQAIPAVRAWGLISEPYTFLVDADGKVAARLDGPIDPTELREAIDALPSG